MGWRPSGGYWLAPDGECPDANEEWQPSLLIQHAWQVIERIQCYCVHVQLSQDRLNSTHGEQWVCVITDVTWDGHAISISEFHKEAPVAICMAALKYVEEMRRHDPRSHEGSANAPTSNL